MTRQIQAMGGRPRSARSRSGRQAMRQTLLVVVAALLAGCPEGIPAEQLPDGGSSTGWQELYPDSAPLADGSALVDDPGADASADASGADAPGADRTDASGADVQKGSPALDSGAGNSANDAANSNIVTVPVSGDCMWVSCPANAPYPVGCNITMGGGDCRGCVVSSPSSSAVYFREGDACKGAPVQGTLLCSSVPGNGLHQGNCGYNKLQKYYVQKVEDCPTGSGDGC